MRFSVFDGRQSASRSAMPSLFPMHVLAVHRTFSGNSLPARDQVGTCDDDGSGRVGDECDGCGRGTAVRHQDALAVEARLDHDRVPSLGQLRSSGKRLEGQFGRPRSLVGGLPVVHVDDVVAGPGRGCTDKGYDGARQEGPGKPRRYA